MKLQPLNKPQKDIADRLMDELDETKVDDALRALTAVIGRVIVEYVPNSPSKIADTYAWAGLIVQFVEKNQPLDMAGWGIQ